MVAFGFRSRTHGAGKVEVNNNTGNWVFKDPIGRNVTHFLPWDEVHKIDLLVEIKCGREDLTPLMAARQGVA